MNGRGELHRPDLFGDPLIRKPGAPDRNDGIFGAKRNQEPMDGVTPDSTIMWGDKRRFVAVDRRIATAVIGTAPACLSDRRRRKNTDDCNFEIQIAL